ncbi:MAG: DUF6263 family protein [Planctomycetota bacterium]
MSLRMTSFYTLLAAVAGMAATGVAQESLSWKFQPGETLHYVVVPMVDMDMSVPGEQSQKMSTNQTMDMLWKISDVQGDGLARMTQVVDRVRMDSSGGPAGSMAYDSQSKAAVDPRQKPIADAFGKIIGAEFQVAMRPTGKIDDVVVPESLVKALTDSGPTGSMLTEASLKEMMTQSAVSLPAEAIKPGAMWSTSQQVDLNFGTMVVTSNLTYLGTKDGMAQISTKPSIDVKPKDNAVVGLKLTKSEGKGLVQFDVEKGRISRSDLSLKLDLAVTRFGKTVNMTLNQATAMNLAE